MKTDAAAKIIDKLKEPLHNRSMLVTLSISRWEPKKQDRKLAAESAAAHGSEEWQHDHKRSLLAKGALTKITAAEARARKFFYQNTSPWLDAGKGRILYAKNFLHFMQGIRAIENEFNEALVAFEPDYPAMIEAARPLLGDTFNIEDYPPVAEIMGYFAFSVRVSNLPAAEDFRVPSIGDAEQDLIRAEIAKSNDAAIDAVVKDLWAQIKDNVEHMKDGLTKYEKKVEEGTKGRAGTFNDSIVDNVRELAERLPRLNLSEDDRLEQMRVRLLRELCQDDADVLRESPLTRQSTLQRAESILATVGDFI